MLSYFPKQISNRGIYTYFISLAVVSIIFWNYAMSFKFMLIGSIFVFSFFNGSANLSRSWKKMPREDFIKKLFWISLLIRVAFLIFACIFYTMETGNIFGWQLNDAVGYDELAVWLMDEGWSFAWDYLFGGSNVSDSGYVFYLCILYSIWGHYVIPTFVINTVLSSFTCVLMYKMASRDFGETTGRMAGIFCMLMPNMIYYCTVNLKETLMVFLVVAFLERADYAIRSKINFITNVTVALLLALSLFLFRTVLGSVCFIAFMCGIIFSSNRVIKKSRRTALIIISIAVLAVVAKGTIMSEVEGYWNNRNTNQDSKRYEQTSRGNQWAKYATGVVMAPMIFVVPFSTMVDVDNQYTQQLIHGGNFIKNFMAVFTLFAFFVLLFKEKKWREHIFTGAFAIGYMLVLAMSGFANSERFHFPVLPLLLMFDAYGVSVVNANNVKWVNYWSIVVIVMEFGWAFFKLGSRGIGI